MAFELCNCLTKTPEFKYHKRGCPVRKDIKFPTLFYYEEAVDSYIPAPDSVENMISVEYSLDPDETIDIRFKRFDLTDEEFDKLIVV